MFPYVSIYLTSLIGVAIYFFCAYKAHPDDIVTRLDLLIVIGLAIVPLVNTVMLVVLAFDVIQSTWKSLNKKIEIGSRVNEWLNTPINRSRQ